MDKVKALVDYLNQILTNDSQAIDQYEDYYRQISQFLFDIDTEFNLELITDDVEQGKVVYEPKKDLVQIYLNLDNDFHYFIYEIIDDFLSREQIVSQAIDYFISLLRNDKIEYIAQVLIGIGDKDELSEEEDKLVTGAHEYLWQILDMMSSQEQEDTEDDMLYSIKIINTLLRFAGLDLQNMKIFELQYDFGMLNLESLKKFLAQDIESTEMDEESKEVHRQAYNIVQNLVSEVEDFIPNPQILSLPTKQLSDKIANMDYMAVLQWLSYLKGNNMAYEYRAVIDKIIEQQQESLDKQNWDDALVLSNILVSVDTDNTEFRALRILALLGLRLYFDAYQDYKILSNNELNNNEVYKFIKTKLSAIGLK